MIDSIDGIMRLISDRAYNEDIGRLRSAYFFRGLPDVRFRLTTSLRMNCKELHRELEPAMLRAFTKYASMDDPTLSSSVRKQMVVGAALRASYAADGLDALPADSPCILPTPRAISTSWTSGTVWFSAST